jgi:hypothetical protein
VNSSKRVLLVWLEPFLPLIVQKLDQNDRLVEVR